jgi:hypothetical protein
MELEKKMPSAAIYGELASEDATDLLKDRQCHDEVSKFRSLGQLFSLLGTYVITTVIKQPIF